MWDTEGRLIHRQLISGAGAVDVVIAPGMLLGPDLQPINLDSIRQAAGWFNKLYQQGVWVAAAGTGGVILGEAGLLNDRSFTTTVGQPYAAGALSTGATGERRWRKTIASLPAVAVFVDIAGPVYH